MRSRKEQAKRKAKRRGNERALPCLGHRQQTIINLSSSWVCGGLAWLSMEWRVRLGLGLGHWEKPSRSDPGQSSLDHFSFVTLSNSCRMAPKLVMLNEGRGIGWDGQGPARMARARTRPLLRQV